MNRIKEALKRKIGPAPAWAWLAALAGAVYWYRLKKGTPPTTSSDTTMGGVAQPDLTGANVPGAQDASSLSPGTDGTLAAGADGAGGLRLGDLAQLLDAIGGFMASIGGGSGGSSGGGGGDGGSDSSGGTTDGTTTKKGTKPKGKPGKTKRPPSGKKKAPPHNHPGVKAPSRPRSGGKVGTGSGAHRPGPRKRSGTHPRPAPARPAVSTPQGKHNVAGPSRTRTVPQRPPERRRSHPTTRAVGG